jgi:hypothetical protein
MGGSCQDRPGLTPVCRATTFLIQPNVKSQPLDERLKWLTAPGRRIPGAVTWPGFVGIPAQEADGPPSGRCWERRTIDLRKKRHRRWQRYSVRLHIAVEPGASPKQPLHLPA